MAEIVAVVVVGPVAVFLAIRLIVLFVVAEQVSQGESVMDGYVVDARPRRSSIRRPDVRRRASS